MTIAGIDLAVARKIVKTRNGQGFFHSLDDMQAVVSPEVMRKLESMSEEMKRLQPYQRE
jgi:DNA uptake protein ComE-like DNA-binding protein